MARRDAPLPGVTAVVPAYNMEAFLERTLTSAIRQTYPELDIVVIDDGSTDRTREVAERVAATHDRIRVESVANAGVAAARNLGTRLARTPYVAYLDADDLWHPEKIARQVAALAAHGHEGEWAASYALTRYIGIADEVLGNGPSVEARGPFFEKHLYRNHVGNGSALLVRRDAALALGGFDQSHAARGIGGLEDYDFQLRLLSRYRLELVREFLVGYRIRPGQMSDDADRMSRARPVIIEAVLADCPLSQKQRRQALAHARIVAAWHRLLAGHPFSAAADLARAIRQSPGAVSSWLPEMVKAKLAHRAAARKQPWAASAAARRFEELDPLEEVAPHDGGAAGAIKPRAAFEAMRARSAPALRSAEAPASESVADRSARAG